MPVKLDPKAIKDFIVAHGWIEYEPGQSVTPPSKDGEWWYHRNHPDGDWYRTPQQVFEDLLDVQLNPHKLNFLQTEALDCLNHALKVANQVELLGKLSIYVHPDEINRFCYGVDKLNSEQKE